jgi:hypothetical protein
LLDTRLAFQLKLHRDFTHAHLVALISGRVGLRLVDRGNTVSAALVVITQLQPITSYSTSQKTTWRWCNRRSGMAAISG